MSEKFYDEFYRQRRNLILISVVLFFVISSDLTWDKFSVWGNEITLKNPDGVITFLWVIWAYWIWRFWVYALEYKNGFFFTLINESLSFFRGKYVIIFQEKDYYLYNHKISLLGYKLEFYPRLGSKKEENIAIEEIKGFAFYKFVMPFFIKLAISHKSFTDQILPFLIAIFPIIFLVFTKGIF